MGQHEAENKMEYPKNIDQVLEKLGGFGPFQALALLLILSMEIPTAMLVFIPVFIVISAGGNPSTWLCDNETISKEDACNCSGTLEPVDAGANIVAEWNLICDLSWVSDATVSLQLIAMLIGTFCFCQLSDWYGRRYSFVGIVLLMMLSAAMTASATGPYFYMVARIICGASFSGFLSINTTYCMELMTPKWRPLCTAVGPSGIGIMLLALLAWYIQGWRTLAWATAAPFAAIFLMFPFLPESPRWLLSNQRVDECLKVTKYIAWLNRSEPIRRETLQGIVDREVKAIVVTDAEVVTANQQQRSTYMEFWRDLHLRKTTFCLQGLWFCWTVVYFGISYNIKNLAGNLYMNVVYMGLSETVGYASSFTISDRLGRRQGLFITMTSCAASLALIAVLQLVIEFSLYPTLLTVLCCLGRYSIAAARSLARTVTGESYPTDLRTMGIAVASSSSAIAGALSAQVVYFGSTWPYVPFFVFGAVSILGSLMGFLLKETAGMALKERSSGNDDDVKTCRNDFSRDSQVSN